MKALTEKPRVGQRIYWPETRNPQVYRVTRFTGNIAHMKPETSGPELNDETSFIWNFPSDGTLNIAVRLLDEGEKP